MPKDGRASNKIAENAGSNSKGSNSYTNLI